MADDRIAEELFKTIDIITDQKIYLTEYLYTEDCTIVAATNDPYLYRVQHEQQEFDAYCPLGEYYDIGQTVVVLFTDYSKITRKIILFGTTSLYNDLGYYKKTNQLAVSNRLTIEGSPYVVNGVSYGTYSPFLTFKVSDSSIMKSYDSYNIGSYITSQNPFGYTAQNSNAYLLNFNSTFYRDNSISPVSYINIPTGVPLRIGENILGYPAVPLSISTGYLFGYLQTFYYNGTLGRNFLGGFWTDSSNLYWYNASDYRLKEGILPLTESLSKINKLNPVSWTWKATQKEGQGFIAHEVQEVLPNITKGDKDALSEDGTEDYQLIDTTKIIPVMVGAIKELSAQIEELKAEIQLLKGGV